MRNHHRLEEVIRRAFASIFYQHGENTKNKVENLKDYNLAGQFFSLFSRVMSQRKDFYNDYDENKKKQQVQDFLTQYAKHLLTGKE